MDNSIRRSYLAYLRDAISRILSDVDRVHQLTFLIEKTSFDNSEGKLDAYINYIQESIQTLELHKEGYVAGVSGQQGLNNSNQSQMPQQLHHQTSQGALHSQPLKDHQQQQIQNPNIPSQPLVDHQQQQLQQPTNLNQHSMGHHKQPSHTSQPFVGNQQQHIQQPNNPSQPSMGRQQQPSNPSQPLVAHKQDIQQAKIPSQPTFGHQQQRIQPPNFFNQSLMGSQQQQIPSHLQQSQRPNFPNQPLTGPQHQQIQHPNMPIETVMGQHQQQISNHWQQSQRPNFPNQPLMGPQQQHIQNPNMPIQISNHWQQSQRPNFPNQPLMGPQQQHIQNPNMPIQPFTPFTGHPQQQNPDMPIQAFMGNHQQQNPSHQQQSHRPNFPSNPWMDHQQQQNNQQPSMGYQQQTQTNSKQSKTTTEKARAARKAKIKSKQQPQQQQGQVHSNPSLGLPASQLSQYQGHPTFNPPLPPQNPYQQQNAFPYQHQYRFPPSQQSQNPQNTQLQRPQVFQYPHPSHLQQNQFSLDSQQLQHKPNLKRQEQNQLTPQQPKRGRKAAQQKVKKDSGLPAPQPHLVPQFSNQRSQPPNHTSNQNVAKNELAKNSMVAQSNNQESKQILLNTPNRGVPSIESYMKENLDNGKLDQTQSSTSIVAEDAAKRELISKIQSPTSSLIQGALERKLGPIKHDKKEAHNEELERARAIFQSTASSNAKEVAKSEECSNRDVGSTQLDMKQAHNEELERESAIFEFTASSNAKEVSKSEECSNRDVGSIQLDIKEAHNEEMERAPAIFQLTASSYAKEVANQEGDSTKLSEKEDNKEELEKAPSYQGWLSELVNIADADACSGLDYDVEADASACLDYDVEADACSGLDFTAPQENATGKSIEPLLNQITSMEPNTFRDAVIGEPYIEQERWLQEYNRIANPPEESNCTDKESTQNKIPDRTLLELVEKDIIAIRNKIIDISGKISEDEEEKQNAFMNINPESVTEEDTKNGIFVNLSYLAISLDKDYKRVYNSQPKMQIKPLRVLIPPNYPRRSPIILERYPESSQITEEFSAKAIAKFFESASCVEEPITLPKVAEIWNKSTREVVVSYAVKRGGGTFTSQYGGWTYCDK